MTAEDAAAAYGGAGAITGVHQRHRPQRALLSAAWDSI